MARDSTPSGTGGSTTSRRSKLSCGTMEEPRSSTSRYGVMAGPSMPNPVNAKRELPAVLPRVDGGGAGGAAAAAAARGEHRASIAAASSGVSTR